MYVSELKGDSLGVSIQSCLGSTTLPISLSERNAVCVLQDSSITCTKTRTMKTNWFSEEAPFWLEPQIIYHRWLPSSHTGTRPEQGGQGSFCQREGWDSTLRFLSRDITVYVPFWFESNPLESMQRLLINNFRNHPTGITVRGGGLQFYASYISPAKAGVFPTGVCFPVLHLVQIQITPLKGLLYFALIH